MTPIEQIRSNILDLQNKLLEAHPQMPVLLKTIHDQLKEDPTNVTLLSEEEINIIVSGLEKQTGVELGKTISKQATTKKLSKMTSADLGF